jgi:hypothetical protein
VTVEVGGRLDEEAHELAYEGMGRYFSVADVFAVCQYSLHLGGIKSSALLLSD